MSETPAPTRPRIPDDVISSWATNDMDLFLRDFALDLRDARADSLALREALRACLTWYELSTQGGAQIAIISDAPRAVIAFPVDDVRAAITKAEVKP